MKVAQLCLILCDPIDYTVHGILHARIGGWVAIPFSRYLPDPGIKPGFPLLQADSLPAERPGKPFCWLRENKTSIVTRILDLLIEIFFVEVYLTIKNGIYFKVYNSLIWYTLWKKSPHSSSLIYSPIQIVNTFFWWWQ